MMHGFRAGTFVPMVTIVPAALAFLGAPLGAHERPPAPLAGDVVALDAHGAGEHLDVLVSIRRGESFELEHTRSSDAARSWQPACSVHASGRPPNSPHRGNDPQIAAAGDMLVAAWTSHDPASRFGAGEMVTARSSDGGRSWEPGVHPSDVPGPGQSFIDLAADHDGTFHLVWLDTREGRRGLRATRSRDGGRSWESDRTLDPVTCECCWNKALAPASGQLYVLYRDRDPRDMAVAASFDQGGSWQRTATVGDFEWQFDGCPHVGGALASSDAGNLHALVWTGKQDRAGVYALHSEDSGKSWSEPTRLGRPTARNVDLVARGETLYGVYDERDGEAWGIYLVTSQDGATFSPPKKLSTDGVQAIHPLARLVGGEVVVLWTESPPEGEDRWVARRLGK